MPDEPANQQCQPAAQNAPVAFDPKVGVEPTYIEYKSDNPAVQYSDLGERVTKEITSKEKK